MKSPFLIAVFKSLNKQASYGLKYRYKQLLPQPSPPEEGATDSAMEVGLSLGRHLSTANCHSCNTLLKGHRLRSPKDSRTSMAIRFAVRFP